MKIAVVAPSGPFSAADYARSMSWALDQGFEIVSHAQARRGEAVYLNGHDEERKNELIHALQLKTAQFCWLARGGYGLTRIMPSFKLSQFGPIAIGYSDATALHCHLWATYGRKGIHGPGVVHIAQEPEQSRDALLAIMRGHAREIEYPLFNPVFHRGEPIEGTLVPANLCVLSSLVGTLSMPRLNNAILMLEDVNESPYRIDRMLTQLWAAGCLRGLKALIMGTFSGCSDPQRNSSAELAITQRCKPLGIPLFSGFAFGHQRPNWPLPFGCRAKIVIKADQAQLQILEEVVSG